MDANNLARKLRRFGDIEHGLTVRLQRVQQKRCELLTDLACSHGATLGLSTDVVAASVVPKEPPPEDGDGD